MNADLSQKARERRQFPRYEVLLRVDYPDREDLSHDCTGNISCGGAYISTREPFEVGDSLELDLSFPGFIRPMPIQGHVVRRQKNGSPDTSEGVGIAFDFSDDEEKESACARDRLHEAWSVSHLHPGHSPRLLGSTCASSGSCAVVPSALVQEETGPRQPTPVETEAGLPSGCMIP